MPLQTIDHSDLNFPDRDLSNDGLGIVVTLLVCWEIVPLLARKLALDAQSSCTLITQIINEDALIFYCNRKN